jgi:hypothetical protein
MEDFSCQIACPPRWAQLQVENPGDRVWADEQARELLGGYADETRVAELSEQLLFWTRDCAGRAPAMALALVPEGGSSVLAITELQVYAPGEDEPVTVDWLAGNLGMARAGALRGPDRSTVDLPAGPAVRLHGLYPSDSGDGSSDGDDDGTTVVECVMHAVRPPQLHEVLVLQTSWTALAYGEALAGAADDLAAELAVIPA